MDDPPWEQAQKDILYAVEEVLARIEWVYGDNRAPYCYPPQFIREEADDGTVKYTCVIELDPPGEDDALRYESCDAAALAEMVATEQMAVLHQLEHRDLKH